MILETKRLYLRELSVLDFESICKIMQDNDVMYAYEGAFDDNEVQMWLNRQIERYAVDGFGLWAVILKDNDELIGQCGLTLQKYNDQQVLEIGYLFRKDYWHQGYAKESAIACKEYAFDVLKVHEVFSIIRDTNIASQNVALKNGMILRDQFIKQYRSTDMLHYVYSIKKADKQEQKEV